MTAAMTTTDRFERPNLLWYVFFDTGLTAMGVMSFNADAYEAIAATAPVPSRRTVQALFAGSVALHVAEATMAYKMAKRRGMDQSAARWARAAFIVGFPALLKLRRVGGA